MPQPQILIIDDEPAVFESLEALLATEGYSLSFARNGVEGISRAISLLPDVILLDLMMPGMDGFEVCHHLRSEERLAEVPILMITAFDEREMKLRGLNAGADDFLSKPIDRLELRARLRTIIRLDRYRKLNQERARLEQALRELGQSHGKLQQAYDETIQGWSRAMDLRDRETEGHSQRVTEMTVSLARSIGMPDDEIVHLRRGALLHDMGKLGIPDKILHKPDMLNEEEWVIMRRHPVYAYEMLKGIEYLRPAIDIPYCHHEKWNGKGYPRGLSGEEIPVAARIFMVADIWDAIISDRPYRPARSMEYARNYIRSEAGQHLDPHITEIFLDLYC